jgi:hypothetical protein
MKTNNLISTENCAEVITRTEHVLVQGNKAIKLYVLSMQLPIYINIPRINNI